MLLLDLDPQVKGFSRFQAAGKSNWSRTMLVSLGISL